MNNNYFPDSDDNWKSASATEANFDPILIEDAVNFALNHETKIERNIQQALENKAFGEPAPWGDIIGITRPRSGPNGLITRRGLIVAEWGDTNHPDITFSVAKSFLSICAGLLKDDGRINDFDNKVFDLVKDGGFNDPQNKPITWRQLMQMTSEWRGELWGKSDQIDHYRDLSIRPEQNVKKGQLRTMTSPGSYWEYNDVRVNRLSLSLLRVAGQALPNLLRDRVMDPIGASKNWEWHGYNNSWIMLGNNQVQSVSGGSHWGGGMFISSRDQARIGLLMMRRGLWKDKRILSEDYINQAIEPCSINPDYGLFWWLNKTGRRVPNASRDSYCAFGFGSNIIWIEPKFDLVTVVRWIDNQKFDEFCGKVLNSLKD